MDLVNSILNLAGLLLWLNWCLARLDPMAQARASTLAGTIKPAKRPGFRRWGLLVALAAMVTLRAVAYWQIGPALEWTPTLNLTVTILPFRSDYLLRILVFSVLSLGRTLALFYLGLLFLAVVNRRVPDDDPFQRLVRRHLGRVARWSWAAQVLLLLVAGVGLWMALHPLLASLGIAPQATRNAQVFQQALLVELRECLELRYLIAALLLGYLLNSYVYLGNHALWPFVQATGQNLLRPLRRLPLRIGRVDFAPVLAVGLVFLFAELALRYLPRLNPL